MNNTITVSLIFTLFVGVVIGLNSRTQSSAKADSTNLTVYERVIKNRTMRCGYIPYPPAMIIDPNTGEKSGIFYDMMNEIGARLSLKVEWAEEAGWGTFINDLKNDRYDMLCSAIWTNAARAREANHTTPLYYSAITAWSRHDDTRFDDNLTRLNNAAYSITAIDGETASVIARNDFPKAKVVSLPEMSAISDMALTVDTNKADVTFLENYIAYQYLQKNPNSIKQISPNAIRLYGNAMYMKKGEHDFRLMIDDALAEIMASPFIVTLFEKYSVPSGSYILPAKPYE